MLEHVKLTAPDYWASYLINGDASGLEQEEIDSCDLWLEREFSKAPVSCVGAEYVGFLWRHDARGFALAGDCIEYTFLVG